MASTTYDVGPDWDADNMHEATEEEDGLLYNPGPGRLHFTVTESDDVPETLYHEAPSLGVGEFLPVVLLVGDRLWFASGMVGRATWEGQ